MTLAPRLRSSVSVSAAVLLGSSLLAPIASLTAATAIGLGSDASNELGTGVSRSSLSPTKIATGVKSVKVAGDYSYVLKADGTLWATGANLEGQLGDGSKVGRTKLLQVATDVVFVDAGTDHVLWIKKDGTLWATGTAFPGTFGDGNWEAQFRVKPVQIASGVTQALARFGTTLFLKADGSLWGCGEAILLTAEAPQQIASGVAALGGNETSPLFITTAGELYRILADTTPGTELIAENVVSAAETPDRIGILYITKTGSLKWRTPDGSTSEVDSGVKAVDSYSDGMAGSLVWIKADNSLWGAGNNDSGQLGTGDREDRYTPVRIAANVIDAAIGAHHLLYITSDGSAWGVGGDTEGQLGRGQAASVYSSWTPLRSGIRSANAAERRTQLVDTAGRVWAAGQNRYGDLGDGTKQPALSFKRVTENAAKVVGKSYRYSLTLDSSGKLYAAGDNAGGAFGNPGIFEAIPPVVIATDVAEVSSGTGRTLIVKKDGTLWGTGGNINSGWLGDTNTPESFSQIATNVRSAAAGDEGTQFYVKNDDTAWGYGTNASGELGLGHFNPVPSPVQIATHVSRIDAAGGVAVILKKDGTLHTAGTSWNGGLGDTSVGSRPSFFQIATQVVDFVAGQKGVTFIKADGSLWHTGELYADVGIGSDSVYSPYQIGTRAKGLSARDSNLVVLLRDAPGMNKDFSGDDMPDVLWHNTRTRQLAYITLQDGAYKGITAIDNLPDGAEVVGVADFTNDDKADILARSPGTGILTVWKVDGGKITKASVLGALPAAWKLGAVADMNGDGRPDLVARNTATGEIASFVQTPLTAPVIVAKSASPHQLVGAADFNRDGQIDLLFENTATRAVFAVTVVNGTAMTSLPILTLPEGFTVVGVADYDGDTHPDLLTVNRATGGNAIELLRDAKPLRRVGIGSSRDWSPRN